jgi:hypothetical protein
MFKGKYTWNLETVYCSGETYRFIFPVPFAYIPGWWGKVEKICLHSKVKVSLSGGEDEQTYHQPIQVLSFIIWGSFPIGQA